MRSFSCSIAALVFVVLAIGCSTVSPDECWPNTSGGFGGSGTIPIGAGVGATSSGGPSGGTPNPCVASGNTTTPTPQMPATDYINCQARGLDAGACALACGEVGAACGAVAAHPYKTGQGTGRLTYCKNGSPSFTCTYTFANGDGCVANNTILGVLWYCSYGGGK
jgi:hypothetical protein